MDLSDNLPKHIKPCKHTTHFIHAEHTHAHSSLRNKITACLLNGQPNECDENGKRSDTSTHKALNTIKKQKKQHGKSNNGKTYNNPKTHHNSFFSSISMK